MSENVIYFSENLILVRKYVGITQSGLAEKLGVKANTISNYEKGVTTPDFRLLVKLCRLFCLPADRMLNDALTAEDLESRTDWLHSVRKNFDLTAIDVQAVGQSAAAAADGAESACNRQLLELLERKDEKIMELNRRIGRLELELELLRGNAGGESEA